MNRPLVLAGSALAAIGVALFLYVMIAGAGQPPSDYIPQLQGSAETGPPSLVLSIVAGVILAAGAALIGIGMNRWKQVR